MTKKYDLSVFIGRFQPLHKEHVNTIKEALLLSNKVLVIIGSCDKPKTSKNPFSFEERKEFILGSCEHSMDRERIIIEGNYDTLYNNNSWFKRIQGCVDKHSNEGDKIALFGNKKPNDLSTFYLGMFPQWERYSRVIDKPTISSTQIRRLFFSDSNIDFIKHVVPNNVFSFLKSFKGKEEYTNIVEEVSFIEKYKKQYESLPYSPTFVTTDAVVFQAGNVLLIKRRERPGKGLWALPGGFLNADSDRSLQEAMLRELREETGLKVPENVLIGSIKEEKVFDMIGRSSRGRTITHAFNISLSSDHPLPRVKGQDDAEKAKWVPFSSITPDIMFEDHYEIIQYFLGNS